MPERRISACRACGNPRLAPVMNLGEHALSGTFQRPGEAVPRGELSLVRCAAPAGGDTCGLLQLETARAPAELYGEHYGYRSGLNPSMLGHLGALQAWVADRLDLPGLRRRGLAVVDVGSNDGSFLGLFPPGPGPLIGVDPTAAKFGRWYRGDIERIEDLFPSPRLEERLGATRVALLSSIAMFYDLEHPTAFARSVRGLLAPEGAWLLEQSHLPDMLANVSYDTVCHEHLEYYSFGALRWILHRAGFRVDAVSRNDANGGSLAVLARPRDVAAGDDGPDALAVAREEAALGLDTDTPYERFAAAAAEHRDRLTGLVRRLRGQGVRLWGYGASTKGNTLLQYCGIGPGDLEGILEVNPDKFGRQTPGTLIPIVDERTAGVGAGDVLLVLPWHFRDFFLAKLRPLRERGVRLLFPLPRIELMEPL